MSKLTKVVAGTGGGGTGNGGKVVKAKETKALFIILPQRFIKEQNMYMYYLLKTIQESQLQCWTLIRMPQPLSENTFSKKQSQANGIF